MGEETLLFGFLWLGVTGSNSTRGPWATQKCATRDECDKTPSTFDVLGAHRTTRNVNKPLMDLDMNGLAQSERKESVSNKSYPPLARSPKLSSCVVWERARKYVGQHVKCHYEAGEWISKHVCTNHGRPEKSSDISGPNRCCWCALLVWTFLWVVHDFHPSSGLSPHISIPSSYKLQISMMLRNKSFGKWRWIGASSNGSFAIVTRNRINSPDQKWTFRFPISIWSAKKTKNRDRRTGKMSPHRHRPSNQRYKMLFETSPPNYILGAILLFFLFLGLVSTSISFFANDANQTKEFIAQNSQDMNAVLVRLLRVVFFLNFCFIL